jgi:uncharacterized protein YejL (UPF0352 family)
MLGSVELRRCILGFFAKGFIRQSHRTITQRAVIVTSFGRSLERTRVIVRQAVDLARRFGNAT